MTDQALAALKESIDHWRRMAEGRAENGETPGGKDCPLCRIFASAPCWHGCAGCPVSEMTRCSNCKETPWLAANLSFNQHGPTSDHFKAAAQKELAFLESLLPK